LTEVDINVMVLNNCHIYVLFILYFRGHNGGTCVFCKCNELFVPGTSRMFCHNKTVILPFSTATCVPPHAACLTRPTPLRGSSRGELIWKSEAIHNKLNSNQAQQMSCTAWYCCFYTYFYVHIRIIQ